MSSRAFIIHDIDQATTALSAAAEFGVPVILRSAPGAAAAIGAMVFVRIIEQARAAVPDAVSQAVLDCGSDPGFALNALRHGVEGVYCDVSDDVRRRLADIAAGGGATIDTDRAPALDLATVADHLAACRDWLAETD